MHLIKRHHPCNQQASYMESTSIIHGINKHHVIHKRQECYSIIDDIASLIATFKRYALVLFFEKKKFCMFWGALGGIWGVFFCYFIILVEKYFINLVPKIFYQIRFLGESAGLWQICCKSSI